MEYLKSYIGRKISGFIRLNHYQENYSYFQSLGIHFQFIGKNNGILIITDNIGNEIICSILHKEQFEEEKLDGYGHIHYPKADDHLNIIVNKELKGLRLGQHSAAELQGNGFTIQRGKIQAIIFRFEDKELLLMNSGDEIWTEVDEKIKVEKLKEEDIKWIEIK